MTTEGTELLHIRMRTVQKQLESLEVPVFGDLFSVDPAEVEKTVECLERLMVSVHDMYDFKIKVNKQLTNANIENKSLQSQINNCKSQYLSEQQGLKEKNKSLTTALHEKKKEVAQLKGEIEQEKTSAENRLKQLSNDVRKKENQIKALTEKVVSVQTKGSKVANNFEAIGEASKCGRNFYKESDIGELLKSNRMYRELMHENQNLRDTFFDVMGLLRDALLKRKRVIDRMDVETEFGTKVNNSRLISIKEDLQNLTFKDFKDIGLKTLRENLQLMFNVFDKIDSGNFRAPLSQIHNFSNDPELDNIVDFKELQHIISSPTFNQNSTEVYAILKKN